MQSYIYQYVTCALTRTVTVAVAAASISIDGGPFNPRGDFLLEYVLQTSKTLHHRHVNVLVAN